jgi:hypothetical protein
MGIFDYLEPAATIASGAAAEPLAGLFGLFGGGADGVARARDALTYMPRTAGGQQKLQQLGSLLNDAKTALVDNNPPVKMALDAYNKGVDYVGEQSPATGAALRTLPTAMGLLAGGPTGRAFESAGIAAEKALEPVAYSVMSRGGLPAQLLQDLTQGTTSNMARMSKADAIAQGYWHPIGDGKKLPMPISEMKFDRTPAGSLAPWQRANPESMQGGTIIPLSGDRSIAGQNLNSVNGIQFGSPVYLEGGYDFMRSPNQQGTVWASNLGAASKLQGAVDRAAGLGDGNVYGVYSAMGPGSMNFNTMMSDALLEQIQHGDKISKKNIKAFDDAVRQARPEWPGLMAPESRSMLESNGELRHAFVNRMMLDDFQNNGFPNIAHTRYALTDPRLLDEPLYSSGLAIGKMTPGAGLVKNPAVPHKTYDTQLLGSYMGGMEKSIPKEVMYPDWYKARRAANLPESGDTYSFYLSAPAQRANQEWLDGLMNYLGKSE